MPLALSLVVVAAFIHAVWNLMAKRAAPSASPSSSPTTCRLPRLCAMGRLGAGAGWGGLEQRVIACIVASGVVYLGYSLCLQRGYQLADLSVVYPVARGSGPLLSALAAVLLFGEGWTPARALGLAAVVAGIGLISTQGRLAAFRTRGGHAGVRWGLATGMLIAGYTLVDAYGVKALAIAPVVLDWFSSLLRLVLLVPLMLPRAGRGWAAMRGHWGLAAGVGLLSPLAYILVLSSLGMGAPVSVVAPMREMSMMVALLGLLVLREPVGRVRLAGCLVLVAGVVLLGR